MSFLHSGIALAAVAAIALPIVIHLLFRRRRVPLDWAAMDLLREAVRRTNRRLRFEQWLLLALRSLALLALGLGLAVPMLGKSGVFGDAPRTWIVVVDEGTTSALRIGAESELARVRAEALRLIEARGAQDRVGIVLASTPPRLLLAPTGDSERIVRELNAIAPSESPSDLTAALRLAYGAIEADARGSGGSGLGTSARSDGRVVIASAFRAGSLGSRETVASVPAAGDAAESAVAARDVEAERDETGATPRTELIALAPARESPTDVRIASIEVRPAPTGGSAAVRVLLARQGASLEEGKTGLRVEGAGFAPAPVRTVAWERGQSEATVEVQLTSAGVGEATGKRSVIEARIDDDALGPGNVASAIIDARDDVEVGVVGRRGALEAADLDSVPASLWVSRALSPAVGSGMRVREIDPSSCDARALLGLDAIVIARPDLLSQQSCDALGAFVRSGGIAIVLPSGESRAQTWGSTLLPRLGVTMRVGSEAVEFAEARTFAGEQPAHRILASIRPELPMLLEPVAVSRAVPIEGFEADEVLLAFEGGQPFAVAQSPRPEGRSQGARTEGDRNAPDPWRDVPGGLVVLMASSPELSWTNLPVKPFMVPFFGELVRATLQVSAERNRVAVGERVFGAPGLRLTSRDGSVIVLEDDGASRDPVRASGVLRGDDGTVFVVRHRDEHLATTPLTEDAVRAGLRSEGAVRFAPRADEAGASTSRSDPMQGERGAQERRDRIALLFLLIALAALLFEGFLSRIFSHASLARAAGSTASIATIGRMRSAVPSRSATRERSMTGGRA